MAMADDIVALIGARRISRQEEPAYRDVERAADRMQRFNGRAGDPALNLAQMANGQSTGPRQFGERPVLGNAQIAHGFADEIVIGGRVSFPDFGGP